MTRVLFVCLGNICRSPTAQGVFASQLQASALQHEISIDSAGTGGYHTGEPPDQRATAAALKRGYDLRMQRARAVADEDFEQFDLILAMDQSNLDNLLARAPANARARIGLLMDYAPDWPQEVPDPYFGGEAGFEQVLDMLEAASRGLLEDLARTSC
ncbi:low molecular weight phosphotyrosine protein phosphatase [Halopseudomonas laoshanensis]|uniref:protein-tyrosine-phosphatase n=1 Tax=Halopseudomonas laoshanensis TaxID=2268758 RepID=A0A7V7KYM5_9GAMM|nr:low molecular weight protein-tyrosine-phosphatase [Halopseudomonas laoshanensis]KAA0696942.1 low molecular weight phosphotyrosine protein phosphatase [Halopseudomonas laoshanensis]